MLQKAMFLAVLLAASLGAQTHAALSDQVVVRSRPVHPAASVEIDVPVQYGVMNSRNEGGIMHSAAIEVRLEGLDLYVEARQSAYGCFTGCSPQFVPVTVATPVLTPGFYTVHYALLTPDSRIPLLQRSVAFEVQGTHEPNPDEVAPVYEFFHWEFSHFFMTASPAEAMLLQARHFPGWRVILKPDDISARFGMWTKPSATRVALHRFFSASFGPKSSHFYSANADEVALVRRSPDWTYEGVVGYVAPPPPPGGECSAGKPLLRYYNQGFEGAPNHRYVTSPAYQRLMAWGPAWLLEGVVACVPPAEQGPTASF